MGQDGFPRLYAAASLKDGPRGWRCGSQVRRFPRLYAAASLKGARRGSGPLGDVPFSAALCRGLIEGYWHIAPDVPSRGGFPRLYAAASLKGYRACRLRRCPRRFPRLYAAASLKEDLGGAGSPRPARVFRGFMPRPH